ncbi:MAG TPA: hypothetical protein VHE11_06735 [Steroidobacteraceae bacterium]|nr:hypothetical protein [Steroidobacteraceae bacterium]
MFKKSLAVSSAVAAVLGTFGGGAAFAAVPPPSVGGKIYADLTYLDEKENDTKIAPSGVGVDVKRFYLTFSEKFNDTWSANITTDAAYSSGGGAVDVFIKKAFLQYSLPGSKAFFARLGSADLPWIPFVEDLYGYRYVENTLIDRLHFGTSADWGVHAGGQIDGASYAVSVVNGSGYKNPTRSKSVDVEARLAYAPIDGLTVAIGGYSGKLGKDNYAAAATDTAPATYHTANRFDALVAYVNNGARLGVEYFSANDWNNVTTAASDKADGYAVWGSYDFTSMYSVFARWDQAKTSKDLNPDLKDDYFNVGFATHPTKGVDVALVYKHEKMDNGFINSSYGGFSKTLGAVPMTRGEVNEVGIWGQVAF